MFELKVIDKASKVEVITSKVCVELIDLDVDVNVYQKFTNYTENPHLVEYNFPATEDSTIFEFKVRLDNDEWEEAIVKDKDIVKQEFEDSLVDDKPVHIITKVRNTYKVELGKMKPNTTIEIKLKLLKKLIVYKNQLLLDLNIFKANLNQELKLGNKNLDILIINKNSFMECSNEFIKELSFVKEQLPYSIETCDDWFLHDSDNEEIKISHIQKDYSYISYVARKFQKIDNLKLSYLISRTETWGTNYELLDPRYYFYGLNCIFNKQPPDSNINRKKLIYQYRNKPINYELIIDLLKTNLEPPEIPIKEIDESRKNYYDLDRYLINEIYDYDIHQPCDLIIITNEEFVLTADTIDRFVDKQIRLFIITEYPVTNEFTKLVHSTGADIIDCKCEEEVLNNQIRNINSAYRKIINVNWPKYLSYPKFTSKLPIVLRPVDCLTLKAIYKDNEPEILDYENIDVLIQTERNENTERFEELDHSTNKANYAAGALDWIQNIQDKEERLKMAKKFNLIISESGMVATRKRVTKKVKIETLHKVANIDIKDAKFMFDNVLNQTIPNKVSSKNLESIINSNILLVNSYSSEKLYYKFRDSFYVKRDKGGTVLLREGRKQLETPLNFLILHGSKHNYNEQDDYRYDCMHFSYSSVLEGIVYSLGRVIDLRLIEEIIYKIVCKRLGLVYKASMKYEKNQEYKYLEEYFTRILKDLTWTNWNVDKKFKRRHHRRLWPWWYSYKENENED